MWFSKRLLVKFYDILSTYNIFINNVNEGISSNKREWSGVVDVGWGWRGGSGGGGGGGSWGGGGGGGGTCFVIMKCYYFFDSSEGNLLLVAFVTQFLWLHCFDDCFHCRIVWFDPAPPHNPASVWWCVYFYCLKLSADNTLYHLSFWFMIHEEKWIHKSTCSFSVGCYGQI